MQKYSLTCAIAYCKNIDYSCRIFIILEGMWRGSKMSFVLLRPTNAKDGFNIELPLLAEPRNLLDGPLGHQIRALNYCAVSRKKEGRWDRLLRIYGETMDRHGAVIHADSTPLLVWNIFIFLLVVCNFIEIPIAMMVEDVYSKMYQQNGFALTFSLALDFYIIDMLVVRPRVSYEIEGRSVGRSEQILRFYLQNYFLIDLVGVLVLGFSFIPVAKIHYIRLLFFIKMVSLREINCQIKSKLLTRRVSAAIYDFLKLVLFIVFVTNLYACIYFAIDRHYYDQKGDFYQNGYLWLNGSYGLGNLDLLETFGNSGSYIYALFWALQTARTCGYGVATPKNYVEVMYVNFVMLTIVVIFVYFTNGVVTLILTYSEHKRGKVNNVKKAIDVAQQFDLEQGMKNKMVEFITDFENPEEEVEQDMDRLLSPFLRKQFKLAFRRYFINRVSLISLITGDSDEAELFQIDVANIIRHSHYQAGENLYQSKQLAKGRLFLIERGSFIVESISVGYRKLQNEWGLIGRRQFYFQALPIYTVEANEYTSGLELQREEFFACLKKYRPFYEKCRQIIEGIVISQHETEVLQIKCAFCSMNHLHEHCPVGNSWRNDLRRKKIELDSATPSSQPRKRTTRRAISSSRVLNYSLDRPDIDSVYRTTHYFHHYNI